jgi:hypothetical protein
LLINKGLVCCFSVSHATKNKEKELVNDRKTDSRRSSLKNEMWGEVGVGADFLGSCCVSDCVCVDEPIKSSLIVRHTLSVWTRKGGVWEQQQ